RSLFDTLRAAHLPYPPDPLELRRALRTGLRKRRVEPLSRRHSRDRLSDRFARWFRELELPELMRSLDPRLAGIPVLIRGERGTGRSLLARYIHTFAGAGRGDFIAMPCAEIASTEDLLDRLASLAGTSQSGAAVVWLEDADRLPHHVQRSVRDWIEFGLPGGRIGLSQIRWMAGAGPQTDFETEPGLEPQLAETLSALCMELPALRDRALHIPDLVAGTSLAWCRAQGERPRQFSSDSLALLRDYPWPGNLHELESVVTRTLSFTGSNPVQPVHLRFPHDSGWLDRLGGSREESTHGTGAQATTFETESPPEELVFDLDEPVVMGEPISEPESPVSGPPEPAPPLAHFEAGPEAVKPLEVTPDSDTFGFPSSGKPDEAGREEAVRSEFRRLVNAVAHEVRNPLVSIRTFSELLPEQYDDPEFRDQFSELVGQDVSRINDAVSRLQSMVDLAGIQSESVDLAHLLDKLLDEHADEIRSRRLLVLKELDHRRPHVIGDPLLLRDAFGGLLARTLAQVSDGGDVYIASKHSDTRLGTKPSLRVLLRYTAGRGGATQGTGTTEDLDAVMAQTIIQSLGGTFTLDTTDGEGCVIVIDLPAAAND
ncbi:MAG: histidine kinase dimerization/phospho-acceptor domain-containing protein, partial [Myxococcota bacterium]